MPNFQVWVSISGNNTDFVANDVENSLRHMFYNKHPTAQYTLGGY